MASMFYKPNLKLAFGSTMAKGPTGARQMLRFFQERTSQVHRREPNGGTMLEAPVLWTFKLQDAFAANQAILLLFDHLLIPLFMSAPMELQTFFKTSKAQRKQGCAQGNGLTPGTARHYEHILALTHV